MWGTSIFSATWPFDHVTNRTNYVSTSTRLMVTKLAWAVTSGKSLRIETIKSSPSFFFFFSFFLVAAFGRTNKNFLRNFLQFLIQVRMTNIELISMLCCVLQNHVLQVEIKNNGGFKQEHVKPCSSTSKNIKSPLPHCLWLLNLAGWWLNMRGSHWESHIALSLSSLMRSRDKLKT